MNLQSTHPIRVRKPNWLRRKLPQGPVYEQIRTLISKGRLHTVCQEAKCPNQFECFSQKTATFLIMGSKCTRNCCFCSIEGDPTHPPDPEEPLRVADAAEKMKLRYVVVTSVTRDDLADGGASLFAKTVRALRERISDVCIEVLIPDLNDNKDALYCVLEAQPDVLNHNIETASRLYTKVRPQADYQRSLRLLQRVYAFNPKIPVKSGLMLGLGETSDEIRQTLTDLHKSKCNVLTLGQYLQPSQHHLPVERFVTPEEFDNWKQTALEIGFEQVASGPFVRSSYHARNLFQAVQFSLKRET